jgi:hypothetical protein
MEHVCHAARHRNSRKQQVNPAALVKLQGKRKMEKREGMAAM